MTRPVVVIGAGPAGLAAAAAVARHGAPAVVIDERPEPGGRLWDHPHPDEHGQTGAEIVAALLRDLPADRVTILRGSLAWGLFEHWRVAISTDGRTKILETPAIVLATGLIPRLLPFPGWTSPGVMTATAARTLLRRHVLPGRRAAVLGRTDLGAWIAKELRDAGVEVASVLDVVTRGDDTLGAGPRVRVEGSPRVQRLILTDGGAMTDQALEVDTVVLAHGAHPLVELAIQAGCRVIYNPSLGVYLPAFSADLATSQQGLFVAGGIIGAQHPPEAIALGRLAGVAAAAAAGDASGDAVDEARESTWASLETLLQTGPAVERVQAWNAMAARGAAG